MREEDENDGVATVSSIKVDGIVNYENYEHFGKPLEAGAYFHKKHLEPI